MKKEISICLFFNITGDGNTHLLSACYKPDCGLSILHILFYLTPTSTTVLGNMDIYFSFIDEEDERLSKLLKIIQLGHKQWSRAYILNLRVILYLFP